VFVNREINLTEISLVGFDMDYTLCEYKSPEYDQLSYNLAIEGLLAKGYPSSVVNLRFDPAFPIRSVSCRDGLMK
jgi:hypothetical protein